MTNKELIDRYHHLYGDMAESSDIEKMKVFGNAETWAFEQLAEVHPDLAERWLEKLEASVWNNYISSHEYEEVCDRIKNTDGNMGAHWSYNEVMSAVVAAGGTAEESPCYNSYALALTMNMLYSDHSDSVKTYVREEDIVPFYYAMAVEKLKDPDRKNFIRPYFDL